MYAGEQMDGAPPPMVTTAGSPRAGNWRFKAMLETIAVVLLILWALGLVSSYTMGGFIHLLLVAALIIIVIRVIRGRRV
jgi:hypothetical protein